MSTLFFILLFSSSPPPGSSSELGRLDASTWVSRVQDVSVHLAQYRAIARAESRRVPRQLPALLPVRGPLSSLAGHRSDGGRRSFHAGIDIAVPVGTPVIAPADGVVERIKPAAGGYGLYVDVRHPSTGYRTRYAHLSRTLVAVGQSVRRGAVIALSGESGNARGAHLHYEVRMLGTNTPVDPRLFIAPSFPNPQR